MCKKKIFDILWLYRFTRSLKFCSSLSFGDRSGTDTRIEILGGFLWTGIFFVGKRVIFYYPSIFEDTFGIVITSTEGFWEVNLQTLTNLRDSLIIHIKVYHQYFICMIVLWLSLLFGDREGVAGNFFWLFSL